MSFTFENLPDEILMIIFQYSGNIFNIFQTFLGLNQRLNNILLDKRLHLLTNFLYINVRNDYYDSKIFQQISQQLLSINTTIDQDKLIQLLQPLLSFHIQQKYVEQGQELQSSLNKFNSIRQQFSNDQLMKIDHELKIQFDKLNNISIKKEMIKHIKSLVLTKGARLVCDDYELCSFNLCKAINKQILSYINNTTSSSFISINSFLHLFKSLIISNIFLLNNKDYVGNGGGKVGYFLLYTLYHLQYFYQNYFNSPYVNMKYYRITVELFLFILQGYKQISNNNNSYQEHMFEILNMISEIHHDLYIRTVQFEIIRIILDEYIRQEHQPWDDYLKLLFRRSIRQLVKWRRLDIIKCFYDHPEFVEHFNKLNHIRECVDIITRNQIERQFFCTMMDDRLFEFLFCKQDLIFILLDKKERKLLEKLLNISPDLINQLDNDGNDPLLYICLKVNGCRHRIIEMLIKMGSNLKRRNIQGLNFIQILQLSRNKNLYQKLIEHEILEE